MPTCVLNSLISPSVSSKLLAPYEEASKHFTFARDGKVANAAQRIFSEDRSSTALSLKERALHLLTGIALALPLVNYISYFVLSKLGCLMNNSAEASSEEPQGRVRFAAPRAREFHRDAAPAEVGEAGSIELTLMSSSRRA